jgi:type II secretory pathway pseudopilin PulG
MQLENKVDSSSNSLLNEPTDSPFIEQTLDSPPAQENSGEFLLKQEEVVPLIPEKVPDKPQKRQKYFSFWGTVTILGILGILGIGGGLIFLTSSVSCGNKGKQAEAKQNIGAMNRAQQAYFLDNNTFANSVVDTGVGIKTQTVNYNYSVRATKTAAFQYGIARHKTQKSYVGGVFAVPAINVDPTANKTETTTVGIVCEAINPGSTTPTTPTLVKGVPTCGANTKDLTGGRTL